MTEDTDTCERIRSSSYHSPTGQGIIKIESIMDTPTRKNKRKSSEPKKRTDFSIKRFCPDSPGSACSESGKSEDAGSEDNTDSPEGRSSSERLEQSGSSDSVSPPSIPHGMMFYPGHFPPTYLMPGLHPAYSHVHSSFRQNEGHNHLTGLDLTNNNIAKFNESVHDLQDSVQFNNKPPQTVQSEEIIDDDDNESVSGRRNRKNYKNMTRERRIEANARERTRVHTISAAFDALRQAVPSYSYNQKLSKLAILRIACSYIMALGKLAGDDLNGKVEDVTFADCVDMCTQTIQTEGRARRRH
jgi:atonal protein 8